MEKWYKKSYFRNLVDMHIPNGEGNFENFDPEHYADCMQKAGVDTAYVYASNCLGLCLFPSEVGYCHDITKKRDIFGETVKALRARGVGVVGYLNSWSSECAHRHPDWQIKDSSGYANSPKSRFGTCCLNSPYRDYFHALVYEMVSKYDIDGLWIDMIGFFSGDCVCEHCKKKYREQTGCDIPEIIDWTDENYIRYVKFKFDTVADYTRGIRDAALRAKPHISTSFQCAGWNSPHSVGLANEYFSLMDYVSGDFYAERHRTDVICRLLPNLTENAPFEYMISRAPDLTYHTAVKDKSEILLQAYTAFLCGGSFLFIDAIDPDGSLNPDFYTLMRDVRNELEPFFKTVDFDLKVMRDVAVYVNFDSFTSREAEGLLAGATGNHSSLPARLERINKALSREHIDYDILTEKNLGRLDSYKLIIVPDLYRMSERECEALRLFVKKGGRLYISGVSSSLSTDGKNKDKFMLSDVMGVEWEAFVDRYPVYLAPTEKGQPLFEHFNEKYPAMLPFAVPAVKKASENLEVLATLTYPFTDARNADRYSSAISNPPSEKTDIPALTYNKYGDGVCIYSSAPFENSVAVCNYDIFVEILKKLLAERGGALLECDECEYLEHALRHNPDKKYYTLSILNYQNVKKILPMRDINFTLALDILPKRIYSTLSTPVKFEKRDGKLFVTVEKLDIYDVIYIEY